MKERKWQGFAVQSVILFAAVLAFSVFLKESFIKDNKKDTMTDKTAVANEVNMATTEDEEITVREQSVKTDVEHVKKRSSNYIEIPKSAIPTGASVYLFDNYMESEIRFTIEGMVKKGFLQNDIIRYNRRNRFVGKADTENRKDVVESLNMISESTRYGTYKTKINIKTKKLYAPELYETDDSYYISLAIPSDVYDKIVVIDAGHGGNDEGTRSAKGHYEKNYNLIILQELKNLLDSSDLKVYYTRFNDKRVSKPARTALANKLDADLFVSIHCNSSEYGSEGPYGVEALYSTRKPRNSELSNKKLAQILLENVAEKVNNKKRGVIKREDLYLMHYSNVPTAIIEVGYMSSKSDLKYITSKSGQKRAAEGIYNGITEALG